MIIADAVDAARRRRVGWGVAAASLVIGLLAVVLVARQGLTLSHYDARAHLVVSRRIVDSLTPGWRQMGAVWLPLPHLIHLLPAELDWNFRTGYLSAAISAGCMAVGLGALAALLVRVTGSVAAAVAASVLILLNPNVLYLQSTPMTEPILFACTFLAMSAVDAWTVAPSRRSRAMACSALVALVWSRYEGWPIAGALIAWSAIVRPSAVMPLALSAGAAVLAFLVFSWAATGQWFVASGFFVPDNPARGHLLAVLSDVVGATRELGGDPIVIAGSLGGVAALVAALRRGRAALLLSPAAAAALPIAAFYQGHPLRVRYMVALVVACGVLAGLAIASVPRRWRTPLAAALCLLSVAARLPWDARAPMITEAQWETPFRLEREAVSRYLAREYDGTPILASMGSLAHYMQESASHGLRLRNFVHEGNGDLWSETLRSPRRHVRWVAVEARAEGGDILAARMRDDASFLDGFDRVAEGGGVLLFRRRD